MSMKAAGRCDRRKRGKQFILLYPTHLEFGPVNMEDFSYFVDLTSMELAADESFQAYVFRKTKGDITFWENFIALHPGKQAEIDEAIEILTLLSFKKERTTEQFKQLALNRLLSTVSGSGRPDEPAHRQLTSRPAVKSKILFAKKTFSNRWSRIVACSAGFVVVLSVALFLVNPFLSSDTVIYETQYGENTTIRLPDSSTVILNGNTRLTIQRDWSTKAVREVWLEGEAFFDVKNRRDSDRARFVVHTPGMDVEVLGTRFNVFNRADKANVVLNSGKVKVKIASPNDTSSVLMEPDEALEFLRKENIITKKQVKADVLTSWRNKILVFENTPLYQISEMIEYTYGVEVVFHKDVDENEALVGTIPSDNLEVLLEVLAKSSNLKITRNLNQIVIQKMDPESTKP